MVDDKTKMSIALKRFSVISPILNGQVKSIGAYCVEVTGQPIEMPHYGLRTYSPKTVSAWYSDYVRLGIDGLKPQSRSDIGKTRVLTSEMSGKILEKISQYPKAPATLIYDMLIEERAFLKSEASLATVRRFIRANGHAADSGPDDSKQMLRFAKEHINEFWQTDCLYGPFVTGVNGKLPTYLLAYLDDCSRLITHAQFYQSQDLAALRHSFKEAVLRRGLPKILYTDNGKIYRSQSFAYLCANIGVTLLHHGVGLAHQKGKIERFFRTVRSNFLSRVTADSLQSLDKLNEAFWLWLDDYHKKPHSGLNGQSPLDCFLKQAASVKLPADLADFNTKFLVKVSRTVKKDATISLDSQIYETDAALAGAKLDVKYDPDASPGIIPELFLFQGDKPVGLARLVNFHDNSYRKRGGQRKTNKNELPPVLEAVNKPQAGMKSHTISYAQMQKGDC